MHTDSITHTISATQRAGYFEIAPGTQWWLTCKPNKRTLFFARVALGWKWTDAAKGGDRF